MRGRMYNVFDTIEEYEAAKAYDDEKTIDYHTSLGASQQWLSMSTCWAVGRNRNTDNKIVYEVCPYSDGVYTVEEEDTGGIWFPNPEEPV